MQVTRTRRLIMFLATLLLVPALVAAPVSAAPTLPLVPSS